jgi:putative SOS response-associated peptidase YedK
VAAAGHDRCIINLRPEHREAWLTPEGRSRAALQDILSDRAVSTYEHAALAAA